MPHHTSTQTQINSVTPDPSKNQRNPLPPASSLQIIAAEHQDRRAPDHQIAGPSGSSRSPGPDRQTAGSLESQIAERQTPAARSPGSPSTRPAPPNQTQTAGDLMLQETQALRRRRISKPPQPWVWRDPRRSGSRREQPQVSVG
jgi:hypothetical protein